MKKFTLILAGLMAFVFMATTAKAQSTPATYFAGKWDILVKGTPNGDVHMFFTITEKDGAFTGTMENPETKKEEPVTKVEKNEKGIAIFFTTQGYDVNITMEKKDDDHVTGSLLGMFECTGERVKP
jgi:hypothetical protein